MPNPPPPPPPPQPELPRPDWWAFRGAAVDAFDAQTIGREAHTDSASREDYADTLPIQRAAHPYAFGNLADMQDYLEDLHLRNVTSNLNGTRDRLLAQFRLSTDPGSGFDFDRVERDRAMGARTTILQPGAEPFRFGR